MIIIKNTMIPIGDADAMTIWPFIFVIEGSRFNKMDERHERIHGRQQIEMFILGAIIAAVLYFTGCGWWSLIPFGLFYEWYCIEWFIRLFINKDAYKKISFEQEAYENDGDPQYLDARKIFSWVRYLFKL